MSLCFLEDLMIFSFGTPWGFEVVKTSHEQPIWVSPLPWESATCTLEIWGYPCRRFWSLRGNPMGFPKEHDLHRGVHFNVSWWVYCREFDGTNTLLTYHSYEKSPFWQVSFQINHRWLGYVPFFRLQKYGLDWPPQGAKTGGSQIWFVASTCPSSLVNRHDSHHGDRCTVHGMDFTSQPLGLFQPP